LACLRVRAEGVPAGKERALHARAAPARRVAHRRGDGSHKRKLLALAKLDVLLLDDWALQPLEKYGRDDLLEVIEDRAERRATALCPIIQTTHESRRPTLL
jgi:DNA replication protein DnaC